MDPPQAAAPAIQPDRSPRVGPPVEHYFAQEAIDVRQLPHTGLPRRHGTASRSGTARGRPRSADDPRSTDPSPAGSGTRGSTVPATRTGSRRPTARPIAGSPHCSARPCRCAAAGSVGSTPAPRPGRAAIRPGPAAARSSGPRDGRCRPGSAGAAPSGRRRGGRVSGRRRARWPATAAGGERSLASSAPEHSSVTVIQLTSSPVASRAFSTASTCQTSWGAWGGSRESSGAAAVVVD